MVRGFLQAAGVLGLMALSCAAWSADTAVPTDAVAANWKMLESYCEDCHNSTDWAGKAAFDTMSPEDASSVAELWEKAVRKLRGSLMPPPGKKQPDAATRAQFIRTMESF